MKDRIRHLRQADQDENIEAWTAQHPSVVAKIIAGPFSASYDTVEDYRLQATRWMGERMRRKGLGLGVEDAPVWLFLTQPPSKASGEWNGSLDWTMLKVSIPLRRLLVSFHYPWCKFLHGHEELYVYVSNEEKSEWKTLHPPRDECKRSLNRMFDLSLIEAPNLSWGQRLGTESSPSEENLLRLQATTASVGPQDVVEIFSEW